MDTIVEVISSRDTTPVAKNKGTDQQYDPNYDWEVSDTGNDDHENDESPHYNGQDSFTYQGDENV